MSYSARNLLIALALKYDGDWSKVVHGVETHEELSEEEVAAAASYQAITILDEGFPEVLRQSYKPPLVLFYKGDIELLKKDYSKRLAVVGSRKLLSYTDYDVKRILKPLIEKYDIVSGLAIGSDTCGHEAALENGGKTIAVLGNGVNKYYPACNKALMDDIVAKGGLLLSEYPPECDPKPEHFPMRNRIIVGLCKKVLVIEMKEHSGTSIAVAIAVSSGRDVYALPVTISGTLVIDQVYNNKLIASGANIYSGPEDLEDLY